RKARREVLDLRVAAAGPEHWKAVDARWALARVEAALKLDAAGRARMTEAKRLSGEVKPLYNRGQYKEATDRARRALALFEELLGERHPDTITCLDNLAVIPGDLGAHA